MATACLAASIGCYPVTSAYYGPPEIQNSKGHAVGEESAVPPQPHYVGVDPGLVVAGVAAAGLLGYAIGNNHGHHYGPAYGYYGPRYCGPGYYY